MNARRNWWWGQGATYRNAVESRSLENLSETLTTRLSERFPCAVKSNVPLGDSVADLVLEVPDRVVVAELKTGDPDLPLPSSTVRQMKLFAERAHSQYPRHEVIPVVVTNYQVSDSDREVLTREGVRVITLASPLNVDALVADFVQRTKMEKETPA
jgi:hypothetical protein